MPEALSSHPNPYRHFWKPGGNTELFTGWSYPPADYGKRLDALIKANFDDIVKRTLLSKEDIDNPAKQPGT